MTTNTILILFQRHGLDPLPGPLARIAHWYVAVDDLMSRAPAGEDELVRWTLDEGLRTPLFMLEGLYRLYADSVADPLEDLLEEVKLVEDLLGHVDYTAAMAEAGRKHEFPEPVLSWLEDQRQTAHRALVEQLRTGGWIAASGGPPPAVGRHLESLLHVRWKDAEGDRRLVAKTLARACRDVRKEDHDLDALEEGIHELRRDLRWMPIILNALRDYAVLVDEDPDELPVPEYGALMDDPVVTSPFAELPTHGWSEASPEAAAVAAIEKPLRLSRTLFLANTKAIADLGDLKDRGQIVEALIHAVRESNFEADEETAAHFVLDRLGLPDDALATLLAKGRAIHEEITKRKLLKHLGRQFKRQA